MSFLSAMSEIAMNKKGLKKTIKEAVEEERTSL